MKIDLNANFRSRHEVLDGTNYIFRQIMGKQVGEIDYDDAASLKPSAPYPEHNLPISLAVLHNDEKLPKEEEIDEEIEELKKSQSEARYIIAQIQKLMNRGQLVYDAFKKDEDGNPLSRPLEYRDIVILMRSMTWSGDFVEEFKLAGIPLYAEISRGYFDAIEVMVMMNTLRVIDNPYQDIALVSVLRSPFIGMTENELAQIRLADSKAPFYDALKLFVQQEQSLRAEVEEKLRRFLIMLENWRNLARRGSLSDLIWQVYLDTNYYEMVGAMINGKQRQANLRVLHDRATAYEKTSFRGLFRFLRFIDRMRLRGDDLGTAKSISQAENVVRIMTTHSSKGLEFPYVFAAGLGREFNRMDFNHPYLFDPEFGLAVKMIDPEKRIQYTSLPFLAMKEKKLLEMKAEEMRILYVAMTRAKEKLYLVGTVRNWEKTKENWEEAQSLALDDPLPEHQRAKAKNYLDWIGPAVARHQDYQKTVNGLEGQAATGEQSRWDVEIIDYAAFEQSASVLEPAIALTTDDGDQTYEKLLNERFNYRYPYTNAIGKTSKTSVSEIKRLQQLEEREEQDFAINPVTKPDKTSIGKRPQFLQKVEMTGAEKGTAVHTCMEHIPQQGFATALEMEQFIDSLVERQLLTAMEASTIEAKDILAFFDSEIGQQFANSSILKREMPFTRSIKDAEGDDQIIQGIIDCLYQDEQGEWILLDYKTDRIIGQMRTKEGLEKEMKKRYAMQLNTYKEAVEEILLIKISRSIIYAFDAHEWLEV